MNEDIKGILSLIGVFGGVFLIGYLRYRFEEWLNTPALPRKEREKRSIERKMESLARCKPVTPGNALCCAPRKIVSKINGFCRNRDFRRAFPSKEARLEAVVWLFCTVKTMLKEWAPPPRMDMPADGWNGPNPLRMRSLSFACISAIQRMGLSSLSLPDLNTLYLRRLGMYQEEEDAKHPLILHSLASQNANPLDKKPIPCDVEHLANVNPDEFDKAVFLVYKWMKMRVDNQRGIALAMAAIRYMGAVPEWKACIKDTTSGLAYSYCSLCGELQPLDELRDLICPACHETKSQKNRKLPEVWIKFNYTCINCGSGWRTYSTDHGSICRCCRPDFVSNMEELKTKFAIQ